jgi:hypothetical protein
VYASFDIVLYALSPRALKLLGVLSFFHFSNFPRSLFAIAAEAKSTYEYLELVDRLPEFCDVVQFLNDILCPNKKWREVELYGLLEDLQKYSSVTMVPIHNMITLRFHPLVHNWAQDRLDAEEKEIYRAAAVRLFVCGITREDELELGEYPRPHINLFSAYLSDLRITDQAAILQLEENSDLCLERWRSLYETVGSQYGQRHVRTIRALMELADAYGDSEDIVSMEAMERDAVAAYEDLLCKHHLDSITARAKLARNLSEHDENLHPEMLEM